MEIQYERDYLSISHFDTYTIPKFTLITGINGSGKTHLLQAIKNKHIKIDNLKNINEDLIFYFDWKTLTPTSPTEIKLSELLDTTSALNEIDQIRKNLVDILHTTFYRNGISTEISKKITENFEKINYTSENPTAFTVEVNERIKNAANQSRIILQPIVSTDTLDDAAILNINMDTLKCLPIKLGDENPLFTNNLSLNFSRYYHLQIENKLNRVEFEDGNTNSLYLTQEEFISKNGQPPWFVINKILKNANLDFRVNYPEGNFQKKFSIKLIKESSGQEINFNNLSSGEKILVSIVFCIFQSTDYRINCKKPQLILFDEIDATLHPQMSRQLIDFIYKNIVETEGINVIMTTHSPSTVAVAPEESIYLKLANISKLKKTSKTEAITTLTDGVPTLAIDFSGRRQIFVESDNDAEKYEMIYQMHKQNLASELSLSFIGTGLKSKKKQDIGSGCAIVTKIVTSLQENGNEKVFGLIDWDIKSGSSIHKNIKILGRGYWHSIENCLCDPLLITLFLLRIAPNYLSSELNLNSNITYTSLMTMSEPDMQNATNIIQSKVIGCDFESLEYDSVEFEYHGGFKLKVSKRYCQERGHDLLKKIITTFHPLNKNYESDQEKLLKHIINQPLKEHLKATPIPLINAYKSLLQ